MSLTLVFLRAALKHSPSKKRSGISANLPMSPPPTSAPSTTQVPVQLQQSQPQNQEADKKATVIDSSANPDSNTVDVSSVHVGGKYLVAFVLLSFELIYNICTHVIQKNVPCEL